MTQEAISIISIMLGVVILTAWVMWLLLRKSGDDLAMRFDRDAAKDQLTRGVMQINALENENRLLKKVLDDLNEKGLVGAGDLEVGVSQKDVPGQTTAPTKSETPTPVGAVVRSRTEATPKPQPPTHTLESALRQLEIDTLERSIPPAPVGGAPSRRTTAPPKPAVPPPQKDDLTLIKGIGPILQVRLNKLGITRYRHIAALRDEDLDKVNDAIGMVKGRIQHLGWRRQARDLSR